MKDDMTTVTGSKFPTIDISHKPRRYQHDNIVSAGTMSESPESLDSEQAVMSCVPLHNVTIERAILYYEANATGELATLYSNTAKWLRKLLAVGRSVVKKAESEEATNEVSQGEQT